jgi:hypothetical protein
MEEVLSSYGDAKFTLEAKGWMSVYHDLRPGFPYLAI